jgi:hypothetical protein
MGKIITRVKLPSIDRYKLYQSLGIVSTNTIPPNMEGIFENITLRDWSGNPVPGVESVTVRVDRSRYESRTGVHRIHIECPNCLDWVPFGRFPAHYTSRRCDDQVKIRENRISIPLGKSSVYYAGRVKNGYLTIQFWPESWEAIRFYRNGTYRRRYADVFDHPRKQLLFTQPAAFVDWIAEEGTDDKQLRVFVSHLRQFMQCWCEISQDEYLFLTGAETLGYPALETPEQRRERLRDQREYFTIREKEIRERFPWIFE